MRARVQVPIVALIWLVVGIIVALSKSYEVHTGSQLVTFVLAVTLWPIPLLGGTMTVQF
ncbi:hypothetical protein [Frankia sp. Cr1]|uniref:hypothetical protein n=1 Tax=Frankia sp. Cr1 TaxID=3073931 RepID=UPI002AD4C9D4|nr:hypothetical protein [Frankia sp. Cr1]